MKVDILLVEQEIKEAIQAHIVNAYGITIPLEQIKLQVKSKQNFRSEWEEAAIKCEFSAQAVRS